MIKAIIFDYGGVVKKSSDVSFYRNMAKTFGVSEQEFRKVFNEFLPLLSRLDMLGKDYWERLSQAFRIDPGKAKKLYKKIYRKSLYIYPETISLIKRLKKRGYKTAVLSNVSKSHADMIREFKGYELFDAEILSYDVGILKPEKEIYQIALDRLGIKGGEAVFIDDREENLRPARDLGMKTILVRDVKEIRSDLEDLGII